MKTGRAGSNPWKKSMKRFLSILCVTAWLAGQAVFAAVDRIEFFFEPGCEECEQIDSAILPRLDGRLEVVRRDIGVESNMIHLLRLENQTGYPGPERAYLVLNGQHAFGSPLADPDAFFEKLESLLSAGQAGVLFAEAGSDPVRTRFEKMTLPVVLLAGLLDGINPCAISTLVFFMSLLAVSKVRNRQLILLGISFCLASFATYLAIGFGLLRFLHLFSGFSALRTVFEWGLSALLLVFAFFSFRDAVRFKKSGKAGDVTLQLSAGMKARIHGVMRRGLGQGSLFAGGLLAGAAVTALESVCTGQVYVPALVLILKHNALAESRAWLYLLGYNLFFILPLVLIFSAFYYGIKTDALLRWGRRDVVFSKTLLGLFFLAMALLFAAL